MKKKGPIVIGSVVLFMAVAGAVLFYATFGGMISQMRAGKRYMDSLSQADRAEWIDRTVALLNAHPITNDYDVVVWIDGSGVPEELRKLRIRRVDVLKDRVRYVWAGGFDHTFLSIQRTTEGSFRFYVQYDDENGRELWPEGEAANNWLEKFGTNVPNSKP